MVMYWKTCTFSIWITWFLATLFHIFYKKEKKIKKIKYKRRQHLIYKEKNGNRLHVWRNGFHNFHTETKTFNNFSLTSMICTKKWFVEAEALKYWCVNDSYFVLSTIWCHQEVDIGYLTESNGNFGQWFWFLISDLI